MSNFCVVNYGNDFEIRIIKTSKDGPSTIYETIKLDAVKENGRISISQNSFNLLLDCIDNQKFVGEPTASGSAVALGKN